MAPARTVMDLVSTTAIPFRVTDTELVACSSPVFRVKGCWANQRRDKKLRILPISRQSDTEWIGGRRTSWWILTPQGGF